MMMMMLRAPDNDDGADDDDDGSADDRCAENLSVFSACEKLTRVQYSSFSPVHGMYMCWFENVLQIIAARPLNGSPRCCHTMAKGRKRTHARAKEKCECGHKKALAHTDVRLR